MERERIRRRYLPHWDVPHAPFFVTTCLEGSIPAAGLLEVARYRREIYQRSRPSDASPASWQISCWKKTFVRTDEWLDRGPANRVLENPALAKIVVEAIRFFAGERYDLFAFVVMPSHFHWLFQPRADWAKTIKEKRRTARERITYSVNRFTATACNKHLRRKGSFWQKESFDHWVRDVDELERIIRYIEENPVKAGLAASPEIWPYSSASLRVMLGLEWGEPLPGLREG
jgi:type I restriction enzyme R subunit